MDLLVSSPSSFFGKGFWAKSQALRSRFTADPPVWGHPGPLSAAAPHPTAGAGLKPCLLQATVNQNFPNLPV